MGGQRGRDRRQHEHGQQQRARPKLPLFLFSLSTSVRVWSVSSCSVLTSVSHCVRAGWGARYESSSKASRRTPPPDGPWPGAPADDLNTPPDPTKLIGQDAGRTYISLCELTLKTDLLLSLLRVVRPRSPLAKVRFRRLPTGPVSWRLTSAVPLLATAEEATSIGVSPPWALVAGSLIGLPVALWAYKVRSSKLSYRTALRDDS